jgi:hypothetical protein
MNIITETRTVNPFHSISSEIVGDIYITEAAEQLLSIVTHENILGITETTVSGGTLEITLDGCVEEMDRFDVFISIPEIKSISFTGVGNIIAANDWITNTLDISFTGVGNTNLRGTSNDLSIELTGVGDVNAFNMSALKSDISISGVGDVRITAIDQLDVTISGTGDVYYKGNPVINSSISGTGSVIDAN